MRMNDSRTAGARRISAALAALLLSLTMLVQVVAAQAATPAASPVVIADPVGAATTWLLGQQGQDGSFPGFDGKADPGTTTDAIFALAAASAEGIDVENALDGAGTYLYASGAAYANKGVGQAAKLVIAIELAGGDVSKVAGVDPLALVAGAKPDANGVYGTGIFDHAYVILALTAAGEVAPQSAIDALSKTQIADGSWGFDGKTTAGNGDTNTTALVIQALVATGEDDNPMVARALAYLKSTQTSDGSFPYQGGASAIGDSNSTALVVQAIIAAGQDPSSVDWNDAAGALAAFQNGDGAFRYQNTPPDDNLFSTVQALPAVAGFDLGSLVLENEAATPVAA